MPDTANDIPANFVYRPLQPADIPEAVQIAVENFEEFRQHPEYIAQWFERRITHNPWQDSLACIGAGVWMNQRLVGFRAMFVQPWWLNGESMPIAFGSNTCVDQRFRGQGLATQLIERSRILAPINGSVTAGVITQKAFRKCGFVEIGGDSNDFFRLRVGYRGSWEKRAGKTLGRWLGSLSDLSLRLRNWKLRSGGFQLQEVLRCEAEFDDLWARAKPAYLSCLERSSRYLNWRLFDFPTCALRLFALRDTSGQLRAYAIWHRQDFSDSISMAVLRDVFYSLDDETALQALLYHLFDYWRNDGISWGNLEVASPSLTALFRKLGYEPLASHGNRYQIYSEQPLLDTVLQNWYRSGIDGDYFDHPL